MRYFFIIVLICLQITVRSQQVISLYPEGIPNSKATIDSETIEDADGGKLRIHNITRPTLTVFEAPKERSNGTAVIICPGGGYSIVAIQHEGYDVAKRFNEMGVTAFVLKYRIPKDSTMMDKTTGPLQDAQAAIRYVRQNAKRWKIDRNKIGLLGFSAGGHLASTAGTHFQKPVINYKKTISLRPDFLILVYPVISFTDSLMHEGSRNNLIGKNPSPEKIRLYSNELQVTKKTPPSFLVHAKDDKSVKFENSLRFYEALLKNGVPAEIYLYEKGGHGFGMINPTSEVKWMDLVEEWMRKSGWVK